MELNEVEIFKESLDVSRIVMIITIVMAITSVVFSALTLAFQRSHNRRTVKPYCLIKKVNSNSTTRLIIKNAGLGPMIVDRVEVIRTTGISDRKIKTALSPNEECLVFEEKRTSIEAEATIRINYHDIYGKKYQIEE
jgi:hypothetical protein